MLSELLGHITPEQRNQVDKLDEQMLELQGKCESQEDTLRLQKLYQERQMIIRGEAK